MEDDTPEPPVPPGVGRLTGPLSAVAYFLQLDPDLITAAAERSDDTSPAVPKTELARRIGQLPAKEKDALLVRLLDGDIHLRHELHRRLTGPAVAPVAGARRTAAELLDAARHHRLERERLAAQRHARESNDATARPPRPAKSGWTNSRTKANMPGSGSPPLSPP